MPAVTASNRQQRTVMIVDDNPQFVELFCGFLESLEVTVVTASDGVDALEKLDQHEPDLILLDVMMPRMSGYQLCRRIRLRAGTREIPVLMISALNEPEEIETAGECGANGFMSKPVSKAELLSRVSDLLGGS